MFCRNFFKADYVVVRWNSSQFAGLLKQPEISEQFLARAKKRIDLEKDLSSNLQKDLVGIFPPKNTPIENLDSSRNSSVLILLTHLPRKIHSGEVCFEGESGGRREQYDNDEPWVLLTHRASHLRKHPNEISFPGGRIEPNETIEEGALREAEEEIGLDKTKVKVLGTLRPILASRMNYKKICTPCVGLLTDPEHIQKLEPDLGEAPLSELASSVRYTTFRINMENLQSYTLPVFLTANFRMVSRSENAFKVAKGGHYRIWGLSAAILHEALCSILSEKQQKNFNL